MFFMDSLASIGDLFSDAQALIRGGSMVVFEVPPGRSARDVTRHLATCGIRSWALRGGGDFTFAVNVPTEQKFLAEKILERMQ